MKNSKVVLQVKDSKGLPDMVMESEETRLVLGTVQLGLDYGIANENGKPTQDQATAIIQKAWDNGIREFDTAQAYGTSENVLGIAFKKLGIAEQAKVISKFDPKLNHLKHSEIFQALDNSLKQLGIPFLYGMMLHKEEMLSIWDKGLAEILRGLFLSGKIKYIGVSVYSPEKASQALNTEGIDIIQLPTNILDRRFEKAGIFKLAEKRGKKIYIRSAFLQGLILMKADELSKGMQFVQPLLAKLEDLAYQYNISKHEMALNYLKVKYKQAKVIFGAETPEQVRQNIRCFKKDCPDSLLQVLHKNFSNVDQKILNPTSWPQQH